MFRKNLGKRTSICKNVSQNYYTTHYRECKQVGDQYFYVGIDTDECKDKCNETKTACITTRCSPFYKPWCFNDHTIKYCKDDTTHYSECNSDEKCVDTGENGVKCLKQCPGDSDSEIIMCECTDNGCWINRYICTKYDDDYYLKYKGSDKRCTGTCNSEGNDCMDDNEP